MIGVIPDIPGLASRHFPSWRKAVAASDLPFALTRRLFAAAIGKALRGREGEIYFDEFITLPGREIHGHTAGTVSAASKSPTSTPVSDSSRNTRLIGTPTDRPRMTRVSVCVPTASAM